MREAGGAGGNEGFIGGAGDCWPEGWGEGTIGQKSCLKGTEDPLRRRLEVRELTAADSTVKRKTPPETGGVYGALTVQPALTSPIQSSNNRDVESRTDCQVTLNGKKMTKDQGQRPASSLDTLALPLGLIVTFRSCTPTLGVARQIVRVVDVEPTPVGWKMILVTPELI